MATYIIENGGKFAAVFLKVTVNASDEVVALELYSTRVAAESSDRAINLSGFLGEECFDAFPREAQDEILREVFRQDCVRHDRLQAEMDRDLAQALRVGKLFDSVFGR